MRLNKLPAIPHLAGAGLREMSERDIPQVAALYTRYMERFTMAPIMDLDELKHMFLSGVGEGPAPKDWAGRREKQVVWAYVVEVRTTLIDYCGLRLTFQNEESTDTQDYGLLYILLTAINDHKEHTVRSP